MEPTGAIISLAFIVLISGFFYAMIRSIRLKKTPEGRAKLEEEMQRIRLRKGRLGDDHCDWGNGEFTDPGGHYYSESDDDRKK